MLRNPCDWAGRRFVAFLLLCLVCGPTARGGPINSPPPFLTASSYTLSGNVFQQGTASGVPGVLMTLVEYSPNLSTTIPVNSFTAYSSSSGSYGFSNLVPGDFYTLLDTPPSSYTTTSDDSIGNFTSATGSPLAPPTAFYPAPPTYNYPANGTQYSNTPGYMFYINLPEPTGAFAPTAGGSKYAAVNYNFDVSAVGALPPGTGIISSLALVGTENRFLVGASLAVTSTVENPGGPGASNLDWQITSLTPGLSLNPVSGTSLPPGNASAANLTGTVTGITPGTQNSTMTVSGSVSGTSTSAGTSGSSIVIDPVEPRQLSVLYGGPTTPIVVPSAPGGLLQGAVVSLDARFFVVSNNANPSSDQTTMVYVGGSSPAGENVPAIGDIYSPPANGTKGQNVGTVGVTQTLVDGSASYNNVPVTISTLASALGPISGTAAVSVASAEAPAVNDTTPYAPLVLGYQIVNVGYAATGGPNPSSVNNQLFGALLSADVPAGVSIGSSTYGSLSSIVTQAGGSGSNSMALTGPAPNTILSSFPRIDDNTNLNPANYQGTVGSECDILASTAFSSSTTVTMSWRNRNNSENASFNDASYKTILPAGIMALTSDVVDIEGVGTPGATGNPTFAMQMTYDDRINNYVLGGTGSATVASAYVVKLVDGVWENAILSDSVTGIYAQTAVADSLSDFLANEFAQGYTLDQLAGSWGVDLATDQSWAILNSGSGQFAVVPEPSTLVLLAAGAAGLMAFRVRRKAARRSLEG